MIHNSFEFTFLATMRTFGVVELSTEIRKALSFLEEDKNIDFTVSVSVAKPDDKDKYRYHVEVFLTFCRSEHLTSGWKSSKLSADQPIMLHVQDIANVIKSDYDVLQMELEGKHESTHKVLRVSVGDTITSLEDIGDQLVPVTSCNEVIGKLISYNKELEEVTLSLTDYGATLVTGQRPCAMYAFKLYDRIVITSDLDMDEVIEEQYTSEIISRVTQGEQLQVTVGETKHHIGADDVVGILNSTTDIWDFPGFEEALADGEVNLAIVK